MSLHSMLALPMGDAGGWFRLIGGISAAAFIGVYVLFAKKKLPVEWNGPLSRFYYLPTLPVTFLLRTTIKGPYWEVCPGTDGKVVIGAVPIALAGHPQKLVNEEGVVGVVNMMAEDPSPGKAEFLRLGADEYFYAPCIDHMEPSVESLRSCVRFITRVVGEKSNGSVYLHCKGGHGRSAAVAMAYLLTTHKGMSPLEAQRIINTGKRSYRRKMHTQQNIKAYHEKYCS